MKVRYQFARRNPTAWQECEASEWAALPKRPVPTGLGGSDNAPGWLRNVSVQGLTTEGYDHVAIEPLVIGLDDGVRMTVWNDDPDDLAPGERRAFVWTIMPLAPDPKLGMAINTRQSCTIYAEGDRYTKWVASPPQNTTVRPWAEFAPPPEAITRHGVWLDDAKFAEHVAAAPQAEWGWTHWVDHLPESETELDQRGRRVLKEQRKQGRYRQAAHTITYYQRDTNRASLIWVATHEDALELTTGTSATEAVTPNANSVAAWSWITPANEPNSADWPNGTYRFQLNCAAASGGLTYGFRASGASEAMYVLLADTTSREQLQQGEAAFSGTGLKLATTTVNPGAGLASDLFAGLLNATGDSHGDAITLTLNTTDSYADGPWPGAAAVDYFPPFPPRVFQRTG